MKQSNFFKQVLTAVAIFSIVIFGQSCSKSVDQPAEVVEKKPVNAEQQKVDIGSSVTTNSFISPIQIKIPNLKPSGAAVQIRCGNILYRVSNLGGAASGPFYVGVKDAAGSYVSVIYVDNIAANSYRDFRYTGTSNSGKYTIEADISNAVSEISETDNRLAIEMVCLP
jgi:hypothetical protein